MSSRTVCKIQCTTAQYGGHDYDDCHSPCHFTTIKMVVNVADFIQRHAHIVSTTGLAASALGEKNCK